MSSNPPSASPSAIHEEIKPHETVALFPINSFIENLHCDEAGNVFVTNHFEGTVYKIKPDGDKGIYASTNGKLTGIIKKDPHSFLLNGWDEHEQSTIWLLNDQQQIIPLLQPEGALFFNGMATADHRQYLICDSYKGCIWKYDAEKNTAIIWIEHPLLSLAAPTNTIPAANGIKIFHDTVFVSNTDKKLLLTIPLNAAPGTTPDLFLEGQNLDDFAFDKDGTIYATTHIFNSVLRITPSKNITVIGTAAQGLTGSTAAAFGASAQNSDYLYVTTNGGMSWPEAGLEEGKVIRLKIS